MRVRFVFALAAALTLLSTAVFAYPNLSATTGLIGVPNANVVTPGDFVGAADLLFFDDTFVNARAVLGLSDRLEAGAGVVIGDDTGLLLNAKYQLPIRPAGFTWAAGASYQTADDSGNGYQLYFVGTRALPITTEANPLFGTIGLTFTDISDTSAIRPFVGAQLQLGNGELGGEFEFESGDFDRSISSIYYRQSLSPRLAGQIGFTNANGFVADDDHHFFLGAALSFAGTGGPR